MLRDISYDREWSDSCVERQLLLRKLDADILTFHPQAPHPARIWYWQADLVSIPLFSAG